MIATSAVNLREYNKIFTGTNQEIGYENPFFGFTTNTIELVLEKDKTTYFHYPYTAHNTQLILSRLAIDGAVAGKAPYYSDKIWKKMADYASSSIWGASQPIGKRSGIWLCSWLSGNSTDLNTTPIWKDRWYNPGYIDSISAMFIENPLSSVVLDIDSEMILDAGSYFKYFHIGDITNTMIVNTLSGIDNLKIHLNDWSENPVDLSPYANVSKIQYYQDSDVSFEGVNPLENPEDSCILLNGVNYCETLYSSAIALTGDFTTSIWAQNDDWTHGYNTIYSKDNRGGYSVKADQGFNTPFMVFLDINGNMAILNSEDKIIISKTLPQPSTPTCLAIDENNFTWVADNSAHRVYKIDYNGDIMSEVIFTSATNLQSLTLDNEKLWVLDSNANSVSSFDIFTNKLSTVISLTVNHITCNLTSQVIGTSGDMIVIDNDNNTWTLENNIIYKNSVQIMSGEFITCDAYNDIWIIFNSNNWMKINANTSVTLSGSFDNAINAIDFVYVEDGYGWLPIVYCTQANYQKVYKMDRMGNYIDTIDLANYNVHSKLKSFTAFDWNRKYNYLKYGKQPQFKNTLFTTNGSTITRNTLVTPISAYNTNWHMFTTTRKDNILKFYVDTILQDTKTLPNNVQTFYKYENPLLLGADIGKIEPLKKELLFNNKYFKGKIDDLRIYDYALDNSDISSIYLTKYQFSDLVWNLPTGVQNYIEEIVRFFKFKPTGQKSQYYNINLVGLNISDESTRTIIEDIIKNTLKKVTPAYTELYKIIWK